MKITMEHVKTVRKTVGMKQYVLAEMLNIEQSNYANMENGKLVTSKIDGIIHSALEILIPKLEFKKDSVYMQYLHLKSLRNYFKNY